MQNEEVDLRINSRATDAQLVWSGMGHLVSTSKLAREDLEAFETTYNAACSSVARGEYSRADILLKRAIGMFEGRQSYTSVLKLPQTCAMHWIGQRKIKKRKFCP